MTPEERANDILVRCWWTPENHPNEKRPPFAGLDKEIASALRAERRKAMEECAGIAEFEHRMGTNGIGIAAAIRAAMEASE